MKLILTLSTVIFAASSAFAGAGEELWMQNCKKCHGDEGKGDTAMGKRFEIKDYTDTAVQEGFTDEEIRNAIVNGVTDDSGRKVMLAFGKKLSEEEVETLVGYVRSLAK